MRALFLHGSNDDTVVGTSRGGKLFASSPQTESLVHGLGHGQMLLVTNGQYLLPGAHFSVDSNLILAWAGQKCHGF